jgi:hypothetical protein
MLPAHPESSRPRVLDAELAVEGRVRVPQLDKLEDPADDRPAERLRDLAGHEVVPVDRAAVARPFDGSGVVLSREKSHVIHLRDALREQLDRPGGHGPVVVAAEGCVVRAIELVNVHAAGMRVRQDPVDVPALLPDEIRKGQHLAGGQDPVEVGSDGNAVVAVEHRELAVRRSVQVGRDPPGVLRLERVQEEARQDEVVGPEAVRRQLPVSLDAVMDLRENDEAEFGRELGHPGQELEDLRLDHEAAGTRLLDDVADRIEPDDPNAVVRQRRQPGTDQPSGRGRRHVEIDLLRPFGTSERGPDALPSAGRLDRHRRERAPRLAQVDPRDVRRVRLAARPDLVERDEEIGRRSSAPASLELAEFGAPARDVVDHHVKEDVVARGNSLDVRPVAEARVDLAVCQRREAAIAGRGERRQDVDASEQAVEWPVEQVGQGPQVASERIRIRQQLRPRVDPVEAPDHPFTDPWRSAAITCRWKTTNRISVGTRMRIVPAQRSGMSVA